MKAEISHMSAQEQSRSEVIRLYIEGYIKQKETAKRMGLSSRQVRRIAKAYREHGCHALVHGNRGKVSNRKIRDEIKQRAMGLIRQSYSDFAPTFASTNIIEGCRHN